jgi:polysaccharide pyruvyl transferase WcaK-like protein
LSKDPLQSAGWISAPIRQRGILINRIGIIGINFDTGNRGVGALAAGAITCLKHTWNNAEISVIDYGDKPESFVCRISDQGISVPLIPIRFTWKLFLHNNIALLIMLAVLARLVPFKKLRTILLHSNPTLHHLSKLNLIVSIAGGDSFSDIYGFERFFYIVLPQVLILALGKKLIHLPQTIGPFNGAYARIIAGYIMRHSACVYTRDDEGLAVAQKLIGPKNSDLVRFSYDLGFVLNPIKPMMLDNGYDFSKKHTLPLIGLNISGLLLAGGYNHKNMFQLKVDYRVLIASLIEYLITIKHVQVLMVPHVFGPWTRDESDDSAIDQIYTALKPMYSLDLFKISGNFDSHEIKFVIGQTDFFIGARMHACIAALSQCIPAVGMAYSRKFIGVMKSVGVESLVSDLRTHSIEQTCTTIGDAIDNRAYWKSLLELKIPIVKNTVLSMFRGTMK